MFPYWFLFAIFAAGALQYKRTAPIGQHTGPLIAILTLVPIAMIGFRYEVGADWNPYIEIFAEYSYLDLRQTLARDDPGYGVVNWLVSDLGYDLWLVNLVSAATFGWGLIVFARRQPNPWLTMVVAVPYLVIVVAMGYSRQAVAIGLIMAAIVYWDTGKLIKFGACILFAATFHKTAIIALPLIAASSTKNRLLTAAACLPFGYVLYRWLVSDQVDRLMAVYLDQEYSSEGAAIRVAMNLVPALIFLAFQRRFNLPDGQLRLWRYFSFGALGTGVLLQVLASSVAVDRIALYLIPLQLFVFSRLPEAFASVGGRANGQLTFIVIAYSALIQFVWLNYATHSRYWVPYQFWPFFSQG